MQHDSLNPCAAILPTEHPPKIHSLAVADKKDILLYNICIWVFPKIGGKPPKWMVYFMENPIKMDDLVVTLFLETPRCIYICKFPRFMIHKLLDTGAEKCE